MSGLAERKETLRDKINDCLDHMASEDLEAIVMWGEALYTARVVDDLSFDTDRAHRASFDLSMIEKRLGAHVADRRTLDGLKKLVRVLHEVSAKRGR